jgi:hypothetical protein
MKGATQCQGPLLRVKTKWEQILKCSRLERPRGGEACCIGLDLEVSSKQGRLHTASFMRLKSSFYLPLCVCDVCARGSPCVCT